MAHRRPSEEVGVVGRARRLPSAQYSVTVLYCAVPLMAPLEPNSLLAAA